MNNRFSTMGASSAAIVGYLMGLPAMYLLALLPLALNNVDRTPVQLWSEGDPVLVSALLHALVVSALGGLAGSVRTNRASIQLAVVGSLLYFALYAVPFQIMSTMAASEWMSAPVIDTGVIFVTGFAILGVVALVTAVVASGLCGVAISRRFTKKRENLIPNDRS